MTDSIQHLIDTVQLNDALTFLKTLPNESVHSIVTSPPYFGQRDYGAEKQIGLEMHPDDYIKALVEVFREARRVLRNDGTFWLNIGDNYVGATSQHKAGGSQGKNSRYSRKHMNGIPTTGRKTRNKTFYEMGLPMKSLVGMPWRVAFALQNDGWILRCDIIWHRPATSESVKDRPTHAHEYIFMFSKKQKYYYDRSHMLTETGANIPSVWRVTGSPFSGAHFAVFPAELIEPIVQASCPMNGIVLDPFGGSGTVGLVARQHQRHFILCDISTENVELAARRIACGVTTDDKLRLGLEVKQKHKRIAQNAQKRSLKIMPITEENAMIHPKEDINNALKEAMKNKDHERRDALRLLQAAVKQVEVDERKELSPEEVVEILTKEAKKRRESIEELTKAGRMDNAAKEQYELAIIEEFLPKQLTREEIVALVREAIQQTGAESAKDMGKVMGVLQPQTKGRADGKLVSTIVKELLSNVR